MPDDILDLLSELHAEVRTVKKGQTLAWYAGTMSVLYAQYTVNNGA